MPPDLSAPIQPQSRRLEVTASSGFKGLTDSKCVSRWIGNSEYLESHSVFHVSASLPWHHRVQRILAEKGTRSMKRDATSPLAYRKDVTGEQSEMLETIRNAILSVAPDTAEIIEHGMLGYPGLANLAAQKHYVALYVMPAVLAEHQESFSGADCGKSCLRFRRPDQINPPAAARSSPRRARGPPRRLIKTTRRRSLRERRWPNRGCCSRRS